MTDDQRAGLQAYVDVLKDRLGLRDWVVLVRTAKPDDDDCLAEIDVTKWRRAAAVFFSDAFFDEDAETQRTAVVHELVHCHVNHARHAYEILMGKVSHDVYDAVTRWTDTELEYGVDGISTAIAPLFPLPEAP